MQISRVAGLPFCPVAFGRVSSWDTKRPRSVRRRLGIEFRDRRARSILIVEAMYGFSESIPMCVMTDSYKATHFEQYPEATKMVAVRRRT